MPDTGVLIDGGAAANASPHEQLRQADRLRESGQLDAAETLYREVLEHSPSNRGALLGLGFCARQRGERPVALEFFRRAASLDPQDRLPGWRRRTSSENSGGSMKRKPNTARF